jgi:hypothetical protein
MIRMKRLAARSACSKNAGRLTAIYPFILERDTGAHSSALASIETVTKVCLSRSRSFDRETSGSRSRANPGHLRYESEPISLLALGLLSECANLSDQRVDVVVREFVLKAWHLAFSIPDSGGNLLVRVCLLPVGGGKIGLPFRSQGGSARAVFAMADHTL